MIPFHPAVEAWLRRSFPGPTRAQELAWPRIAAGGNVLLVAPTGSGKTLAAFLVLIDRLIREGPRKGTRVLYVSPLKALNNDIQRNLELPLAGIVAAAKELGEPIPALRTAVRTGDTLANERHRMSRLPPDILITTPESLYLLLTSPRARDILRAVEHVIVDEIHAVAGSKRGTHLALSLERLASLTGREFQRIGLSATQRPLEEIARFLGGVGREVAIVDAGRSKPMDLLVESAIEDFTALGGEDNAWARIEPRVVELIRSHRTTLVFVNNRRLAERLTHRINEIAGETLAKAHHGSMSREERLAIEAALKKGELRAIAATGSLELGIDIGSVDLVVQIESPKGVARGLQRVGRSGHLVGETSVGRMIPKYRGDLLECAAVARGMAEGAVEETTVPRNPLDVLAQQLVAMAAVDEWDEAALFALVRRAHPYRDLPRSHFDGVLAMLSGKYPSTEFGELRPRVVWDRENHRVRGRPGVGRLALTSGGTIPDRGLYPVIHSTRATKLGELDEEMVFERRVGDVFVLGARAWKIDKITPNRVFVSEPRGGAPMIPFWKGDAYGRPFALGARVGTLLEEATPKLDEPDALTWLASRYLLDEWAAANLLEYLRAQAADAALPAAGRIVLERFRDELGDDRLVIHALYGRPVNLPWTYAIVEALSREGQHADVTVTDDGIMLRIPDREGAPPFDVVREVTRANLDDLLQVQLATSSLFASRFRENAARALLLPRRMPGQRTPLWLSRLRAADLLAVAQRYPDFPIVHETYRELLEDTLDVAHLREVLGGIEAGTIEVVVRETEAPSPFAASMVMNFVADYLYDEDREQPEFRETALSVDRALLRELLGTTSLRDLLDPAVIGEVEARLQRTDPEWRARDRDEVEDLLVRLGDLSDAEVAARSVADGAGFLRALEAEGRVVRRPDGRWAAAQDSAAYAGPDRAFLVRRHLATHGPMTSDELERRFGFGAGDVLADLEKEGAVVAGEFTRGRHGTEYVDAHVLEQIHRATLAKLRREIEPRDPATYAAFLLRWQGLAQRDREVSDVLGQLQGVWLPVEVWERDVLPARVAGYQTSQLDQTSASGEFVWVARRGGERAVPRVAFFRREDLPRLLARSSLAEVSEPAQEVYRALRRKGAAFATDLVAAVGRPFNEVVESLWELVWAGQATNDSFDPLRHAPRPGELVDAPKLTARDLKRAAAHRSTRAARASAGRWSLVWDEEAPVVGERDRAAGWAELLLDRYGVLAYPHTEHEETGVPWAEIADVLRRREMRGEVRRGEFVSGLGSPQFATKAAVERLREAERETTMRVVAAMDPAQPYGAALPSPAEGFARIAGAYLVLEGGHAVLRVEAGGKRLVPLDGLAGTRLAAAVATLPALLRAPAPYRGRRLEIDLYAEQPAATSDAADALERAGFEESAGAMVLWPSRAR